MTSEQRTAEDKFNDVSPMTLDGSECEVSETSNRQYIYVGDMTLLLSEARALLDWLNKVIP